MCTQGSGFYLAGVLLVLWGWSVVGILLESYGFFVLFSGFFPAVLGFLRRLPGLGSILDLPIFKLVSILLRAAVLHCELDSRDLQRSMCPLCPPAAHCQQRKPTRNDGTSEVSESAACLQVINRVAPAQSQGLPY